jgi:hypothetical protein
MHIEYDEAKRATTLHERGLDFADAARVLDGPTLVANSIAAPIMASREPSAWACWMDESWYGSGPLAARLAASSP